MSIANLEVPNSFDLFCDTLTCNSQTIANLNTTNIHATGNLIVDGNSTLNIANITGNISIVKPGILSISPLIISASADDTSDSIPLINLTSNQLGSQVKLENTNPLTSTNTYNTYNNNGILAMSVGNNNVEDTAYLYGGYGKDLKFGFYTALGVPHELLRFQNLGATGSILASGDLPLNITFPNYMIQSWSATTVGAVSTVALTYTTISNTTITFDSTCQGFVTAGTIGNALSRKVYGLTKNVSGAAFLVGSTVVVNLSDAALNAATLSYLPSGSNIQVVVNGVAGQTINWTGYSVITY